MIPKGRIVAADPYMDLVDFETQKLFNTMTLANGGIPVRLRESNDVYPTFNKKDTDIVSPTAQGNALNNIGKEWTPVGVDNANAMADVYESNCYRSYKRGKTAPKALLTAAGYDISAETGKITKDNVEVSNVRPGNIPLGMLERNEYTRDDDAFNGIMPGPILTDAIVEFPWFSWKNKAEENLWGSAYGNLFIGAKVKSDENGRITVSPLSFPDIVMTMDAWEIELENQQVIGQVYGVNHEIVPEGAAKWAVWALEDRLNYEGFNPALYAKNNRRGEDAVNSTAYFSTARYPGYPYDKNYLNHDLHMLASTGRGDNYDPRMNFEFRYADFGIPGLTDGFNAVSRPITDQRVGVIHYAGGNKDYVPMYFRTPEVGQFVEEGSLYVSINGAPYQQLIKGAKLAVGPGLGASPSGTTTTDVFEVQYADEAQGIFVLVPVSKVVSKTIVRDGQEIEIQAQEYDNEKVDTVLSAVKDADSGEGDQAVRVSVQYTRRGEAGVPTFMDCAA